MSRKLSLNDDETYLYKEIDRLKDVVSIGHEMQPPRCLLPAPPENDSFMALEVLCQTFELTLYERSIVLLCAAWELEQELPSFLETTLKRERVDEVNLSLLRSLLNPTGDRLPYELCADSPLIQWQIIEQVSFSDSSLLTTALKLNRWVLFYLMGRSYNEPRFSGNQSPQWVSNDLETALMPTSYEQASNQVMQQWQDCFCPIQLCSNDPKALETIAQYVCQKEYYLLYRIDASALDFIDHEQSRSWVLFWHRQARLKHYALLIDCGDPTRLSESAQRAIHEILRTVETPIFLSGSDRYSSGHSLFTIEVPGLSPQEQKALWNYHLGSLAQRLNGQVSTLVAQFNLSASAIASISRQTIASTTNTSAESDITTLLWQHCRTQSRGKLEGLVDRITPKTTWDDLILPQDSTQILHQIIATIRQRSKVYEEWGMGGNTRRGMGITALFYGPPGTGKTTAAEIIARELQLDLYRVDLSQVVSKYIGETEKNLSKVFDSAETSGAVLLFDEADSMIGKRTDVKDSKDRYANQEVSYLLQRMEAYSGLAVMTTNLPNAIDSAFMRRIKFSVRFEYPTAEQRAVIWQKNFPKAAPTRNLEWHRLAQLNISGANIRNIALGAAFLAADAKEPIQMKHVLHAARTEGQKQGKPISDSEIRGWIV
jgi:AAA+ superfamily predicted ATPase